MNLVELYSVYNLWFQHFCLTEVQVYKYHAHVVAGIAVGLQAIVVGCCIGKKESARGSRSGRPSMRRSGVAGERKPGGDVDDDDG